MENQSKKNGEKNRELMEKQQAITIVIVSVIVCQKIYKINNKKSESSEPSPSKTSSSFPSLTSHCRQQKHWETSQTTPSQQKLARRYFIYVKTDEPATKTSPKTTANRRIRRFPTPFPQIFHWRFLPLLSLCVIPSFFFCLAAVCRRSLHG